ncbi:MAG: hypothetical protein JRI23_18390 [Deltaproteobacteria bacterium]|nr:hypothetical protein [Deltaproteobacteria bacterium]MBW2533827.1 hypothetical protein [Deltaproteobacteria bacterium]
MSVRWWLALTVALAWAGPAHAERSADCPAPSGNGRHDQERAKSLFERALKTEPSDPAQALVMLRCAEQLAPKAAISLRIGTIEERLGRYAAAADGFERYLELAGSHAPDIEPMRERIQKLRARARAQEVSQEAEPDDDAAEPATGAQSTVGWVTGGVGIAFAVVGVALLGAAKAHSDSVHDIEPGTTAWTSDEASGTIEQAKVEQGVGIVGLVLGGALMAVGAILIATEDGSDDEQGDVALFVGPSRHGAAGSLRVRF